MSAKIMFLVITLLILVILRYLLIAATFVIIVANYSITEQNRYQLGIDFIRLLLFM